MLVTPHGQKIQQQQEQQSVALPYTANTSAAVTQAQPAQTKVIKESI